MSNFSINPDKINSVSSTLKRISGELTSINMEVDLVKKSLTLEDGSTEILKAALAKIQKGISAEELGSRSLSEALQDAVNLYRDTDNLLAGLTTEKDIRIRQLSTMLIRTVVEWIRRLLESIGIIPGGANDPNSGYVSDPVNTCTGNYVSDIYELKYSGTPELAFIRHYNSLYIQEGCMGLGWSHNLEIRLEKEEGAINLVLGNGTRERFENRGEGIYVSKFNPLNTIVDNNGYICFQRFGNIYHFDENGIVTAVCSKEGKKITLSYEDGRLARAYDASGRTLDYTYDDDGRLVSVTDILGRTVEMKYEGKMLQNVVSADARVRTYAYDDAGRLESIVNNAGTMIIWNAYDNENRVILQRFPDDTVMSFSYDDNDVTVIDRNGAQTVYRHNEKYQLADIIRTDGQESYSYDDRGFRVSHTSACGAVVRREYDEKGNTQALTDPMGNRVEMTYAEEEKPYDLPIAVKAKNGGVTRMAYDEEGHLIKHEDALGNVTEFTYEGGLLLSILHPDQSEERFEYDSHGNVARHMDEMGNTTEYEYDAAGRKTGMTDPRGMQWKYEYDPCDRIVRIMNPAGNIRNYEYNETGKLAAITDYDGTVRRWEYNELDLAQTYTDQNGHVTRYAYNEIEKLQKVTLPNGAMIIYEYDEAGRKTAVIDELGCRTTYLYDAEGKLIERANGEYTRKIDYDLCGRTVQMTDANGSSSVVRDAMGNVTELKRADGAVFRYEYDLLGQCVKKTDASGTQTEYEFDNRRRLQSICRDGRQLRHYAYYPNGKVKEVKRADGTVVRYQYDACGNITQEDFNTGYRIAFEYDACGRRTGMNDSEGRRTGYLFDASGRVTEYTNEKGDITKYTYSQSGKMTGVEDPLKNKTTYEYDEMDRILRISADFAGLERTTELSRNQRGLITSITDAAGNTSRYEYDQFGHMILHESAESVHTSYAYNANGRVTHIRYEDGRTVDMNYDPMGRMTEMKDWNGTMSMEYDTAGRLVHVQDADNRNVRYDWNDAGFLTGVEYPDGERVSYVPDQAERISCIKAGSGEISYHYDEFGRLIGKGNENASVSYTYCADGKVRSMEFADANGKLSSLELEYDPCGNITTKTERHRDKKEVRMTYLYDKLGRIMQVCEDGEPVRFFRYDAFGNRVYTKDGEKEILSSFNNLNQLVSRELLENGERNIESWQYNKDGNVTAVNRKDFSIEFLYDPAMKLSRINHSDGNCTVYEYDGLGLCRAQTEHRPGEVTRRQYFTDFSDAHDAPLFMEENGESSDFIRDGEITAALCDGKLYYYQCDQQGSVYQYISQTGETLGEYRYDEFGAVLTQNAGKRQPLGYTGLVFGATGNMWQTPSRAYMPETGRFMQKDKERYIHIGEPQSLNLYTYCLNNPLIYIDPDGTDCYYFYLPEWENEALNDQRRLAEQYGYGTDQVHLIPITNAQELTDGWNGMNGDIDTVVINTHANPNVLGFGQSRSDPFTTSDVRNLQNRSMDQLILYGCNAGHRDYEDTNIAEAFSHRTNNAPVMASDGTVYGMNSDETYTPTNDDEFQSWAQRAGNGGRDNMGWQIYQQVDGQTVITNTGMRDATVVQMLNTLISLQTKEAAE